MKNTTVITFIVDFCEAVVPSPKKSSLLIEEKASSIQIPKMSSGKWNFIFIVAVVQAIIGASPVISSDPSLTTDFGINVTSGEQLTFREWRDLAEQPFGVFQVNFAFISQFPAVKGMGIGGGVAKFGPFSMNSLHTHPRASEFFILLSGELDVGILDTKNQLYTFTLKPFDACIFPMGLLHFQINRNRSGTATAFAAFNSENAGRLSIPPALFNSQPFIDNEVLAKAFNLSETTLDTLKTMTLH
ncbi:hypothetical protein Mapa_014069 [Marchantia paleacea]|nr:hypothetical protein Mapa_014069 [Marchantia paleacea]